MQREKNVWIFFLFLFPKTVFVPLDEHFAVKKKRENSFVFSLKTLEKVCMCVGETVKEVR